MKPIVPITDFKQPPLKVKHAKQFVNQSIQFTDYNLNERVTNHVT